MTRKATDKTLRAVVSILHTRTADGTMEQGQTKAIVNAIQVLRRAHRRQDHRAMSSAVDLVAKLFLKAVR